MPTFDDLMTYSHGRYLFHVLFLSLKMVCHGIEILNVNFLGPIRALYVYNLILATMAAFDHFRVIVFRHDILLVDPRQI